MTDGSELNALYPFEFAIEGTPISLQGGRLSRERWKAVVKGAGQSRARETDELGFLHPCAVALTIYYFPLASMAGDVDNIVKPIMDALIDIAYRTDRLVERVVVQKFEPGIDWEFEDPSESLVRALELPPPVVFVRVVSDLSWRKAA